MSQHLETVFFVCVCVSFIVVFTYVMLQYLTVCCYLRNVMRVLDLECPSLGYLQPPKRNHAEQCDYDRKNVVIQISATHLRGPD